MKHFLQHIRNLVLISKPFAHSARTFRFYFTVKNARNERPLSPVCPGLDKKCLGFLHKKAQGEGKLRVMTNLLKLAMRIGEVEGVSINLGLLKQASEFLMV